jgi:hypothetical protein
MQRMMAGHDTTSACRPCRHRLLKQFGWIHAMACPSGHELYVAELLNWRVQQLKLKP